MNTTENVLPVLQKKKETKGQKFKREKGYSLSLFKAMKKLPFELNEKGTYNVLSLEDYRQIRKKRKKAIRAVQKEKHSTAKALRGTKVKIDGNKKKKSKQETK